MRIRIAVAALLFSAVGLANNVGATSFDCSKASTYSEIQICNSPELQLQDEKLNSAYVQSLGRSGDKAALRSEQRAWVKQRDMCSTTECVARAMELRIDALSDVSVLKPSPSPSPSAAAKVNSIQSPSAPKAAVDASATAPTSSTPVATDQSAAKVRPQPGTAQQATPRSEAIDVKTLKIGSFVMAVLLLICIWLHSRGSMVIYSCYTDALWTTMTPFLSVGAYFIAHSWLELSTDTSVITAVVVAGLMSLQIIIQTFRSNGFSLFFLLALYAKLVLLSIYFLSMGALILGGGRTASDRRRRRNWALGSSVLFAALTSWMCRNRQFSHIDDYIAGRT